MQLVWTLFGAMPRLETWEARPFWPGVDGAPGPREHQDVYTREVASEVPGVPVAAGPFRRAAEAILRYDVFPAALVTGVLRRTPVAVGDSVGTRYHLVPGLDLFFASRVVACFDDEVAGFFRSGFSYRTLVGHPELGEETFAVEEEAATGRVSVSLRAWSRPGTRLARAFAPLVRVLQVRAGRAALDHLAAIAARPPGGPADRAGTPG